MKKTNILHLLDGTPEGQLKLRVFAYLNQRKDIFLGNVPKTKEDLARTFKMTPEAADSYVEEWAAITACSSRDL